jgi:hypothetical protein
VLNLMNSVSLSVVKILEIVCLLFVLISGTYYLIIYLKNDKNVNQ